MLYLFNEIQQLIKRIPREHLLALVQRREITSDKSELLNDTLEARVPYSETAVNASYMAVKEESGEFTLYRILTVKENAGSVELSGVNFGSDELDGYIIKDIRPQAEDVKGLLERMFSSVDASDWQINYHQKESWIPEVTDTFYYVTLMVWSSLSLVTLLLKVSLLSTYMYTTKSANTLANVSRMAIQH